MNHRGGIDICELGRRDQRRTVFDVTDLEMADLNHVTRSEPLFGDTSAVDVDPIAAAEIARDDGVAVGREFRVAPRQQRVCLAHVAYRIAADDDSADEHQLALATSVIDDQFSQTRSIPEISTSRRGGPACPPGPT